MCAVGGCRKILYGASGVNTMIRQVYADYHLPILPAQITVAELCFFYDGLINGLVDLQKQEKESRYGK